jgi:hypothetical protein
MIRKRVILHGLIGGVNTPDAIETKSIVAGTSDCKRGLKRLGVNDAMGR